MEAVPCISLVLVMQTKIYRLLSSRKWDWLWSLSHHEVFLVAFLSVGYIHKGHSVLRRMGRYSDDKQTSLECKIHIQRSSWCVSICAPARACRNLTSHVTNPYTHCTRKPHKNALTQRKSMATWALMISNLAPPDFQVKKIAVMA